MTSEQQTDHTPQGIKTTPLRLLLYLTILVLVCLASLTAAVLWDVWWGVGYAMAGFAMLILLILKDQQRRHDPAGVYLK